MNASTTGLSLAFPWDTIGLQLVWAGVSGPELGTAILEQREATDNQLSKYKGEP